MNTPAPIDPKALLIVATAITAFMTVFCTNIVNDFTWRKFYLSMMVICAALAAIMIIFTAVK